MLYEGGANPAKLRGTALRSARRGGEDFQWPIDVGCWEGGAQGRLLSKNGLALSCEHAMLAHSEPAFSTCAMLK